MKKLQLYLLAGILTILGLGLFFYKSRVLGFPVKYTSETTAWKVEARIRFDATGGPAKLSLAVPNNPKGFAVLHENFVSSGYGIVTSAQGPNRVATWSLRRAKGKQTLYYQATVESTGRAPTAPDKTAPKPTESAFEGTTAHAASALMKDVKKRSADIPSLVSELLKRLNRTLPDDEVKVLLGTKPTWMKRVATAARLLNNARIPARVVNGIRLAGSPREFTKKAAFKPWLEVYHQGKWISFDPSDGKTPVPEHWFPWSYGTRSPATVEGGDNLRVVFSVRPLVEKALVSAVNRVGISNPSFLKFSLFSLPVSTQAVYRVMLLIPVGAFLLVLLRNLVGIKTFGTFMPVLIALSFRETGLGRGILVFVVLVALGLGVRFWMERLKLLLVPRLAAVLIVVVGLMAVLSVFTKALGGNTGLSVALFPMVILTMTIERMSIVVEERGLSEALISGAGSIICASLAYLVMNVKEIEHLVFVFPELLLILLAGCIIMGRYTGYRLLDLYRFRALARG